MSNNLPAISQHGWEDGSPGFANLLRAALVGKSDHVQHAPGIHVLRAVYGSRAWFDVIPTVKN